MNKKLYLLPLAGLLLAGCSADDLAGIERQLPISLTAEVEDVDVSTRAGTSVLTSFATNDAFYAYFPSNVRVGSTTSASNTTFTFSGSTWSPATQPYFNAGASSATVHAYYPYVSGKQVTNTTSSFSVETDQSTDANYKKSDLMYATATINKGATGSLTFAHRMAKILVTANKGTGISKITAVKIVGGNRTINIATPQSCTLGSSLSNANSSTNITLYSNSSNTSNVSCAGLIPPQTINGNFLQIVTDQGTATYSLIDKAFASGQSYTFNVTVNAAAIGTTIAITNWANNGSVTVNPASANTWNVTVTSGSWTYNGAAQTPDYANITVTDAATGSTIPSNSSNFDIYGADNTNAGTAKLIVVGKGSYSGKSAETTFTINKATGSISYATTTAKKGVGDVFTNPLINTGDGAVTYSCGPAGVATVNASSGQVTVDALGSARITAIVTDGANYTYPSTMAYYDMDVLYNNMSSATSSDVRKVICSNGHIHADAYEAVRAGCVPSGVICYVGTAGSVDASSSTYKGLAIALENCSKDNCGYWEGDDYNEPWCSQKEEYCTSNYITNESTVINQKNGLTQTSNLVNHPTHTHHVAKSASSYNVPRPSGASVWFLPSMGQWNLMAKGFFNTYTSLSTSDNKTYCSVYWSNTLFASIGMKVFSSNLTSTEYDKSQVWSVSWISSQLNKSYKTILYSGGGTPFRAVFAF